MPILLADEKKTESAPRKFETIFLPIVIGVVASVAVAALGLHAFTLVCLFIALMVIPRKVNENSTSGMTHALRVTARNRYQSTKR